MIMQHGLQKWFGIPGPNPTFANIRLLSLIGIAGVIEITAGALVTIGLFTRCAAFILSGEMAVAYFWAHAPRGFAPIVNGGTLAGLYCFVCTSFLPAAAHGALTLYGGVSGHKPVCPDHGSPRASPMRGKRSDQFMAPSHCLA
jgi:putative oxidoreductase